MITEIVKVLEIIATGLNQKLSQDQISSMITKENRRLDNNIIAAAYSWIYEKLLKDFISENKVNNSGSIRILSFNEIEAVGIKNADYLLHFYNIGLLNEIDLDKIIEKINRLPHDTVTFNDINILILALFLKIDSVITPGSRKMLYSSDKIN